jgi:hypothetical protein
MKEYEATEKMVIAIKREEFCNGMMSEQATRKRSKRP